MNGAPSNTRSELLLAQVGWIQQLAKRLVADPGQAEDLAQETCVVAMERQPRDAAKLRRWLASVMRNLVRQRVRGDGRRGVREQESARGEAVSSTVELVEQVSAQREIVAHVLDLDEPYRTTILLRYFQDLPPREIAAELGVEVSTVNSRLQRAHERLRRRLDRTYGGDRQAWSGLFLPVAALGKAQSLPVSIGPSLGTLIMNAKLTSATILLLAAGTVAVLVGTKGGTPEGAPPELVLAAHLVEPADALDLGMDRGQRVAGVPEQRGRELAPAPSVASAPEVARVEASFTVRGRVLDGNGAAVPGIELVSSADLERVLARTGGGGTYEFETSTAQGILRVAGERWVTVREGVWGPDSAYDPVLVIAPSVSLAGMVRDVHGRVLENAQVVWRLPSDFRSRFGEILEASRIRSWSVRSSAHGAFELEGVPGIQGATLTAALSGYDPSRLEAPTFDTPGIEFLLDVPAVPLLGAVRGRVVGPEGGVPGARVGLGLSSVISDEQGNFEFDLSRAVTSDSMSAVKEGYQPALAQRPAEPEQLGDGSISSGWPDFVVLHLVEPALQLSGRVVDHDGKPASGVSVWIADPTPTAPIGMMPAQLEGLMAGADVPPMALESEFNLPQEDGDNFNDWTSNAGPPTAFWFWVSTDRNGRFELPGLMDRKYRINVMNEELLTLHTSDPIAAGRDDVLIQLPEARRHGRIAGRLTTNLGDPVRGARIEQWISVVEREARVFGGRASVSLQRDGARCITDDDGRFEFDDAPVEGLMLSIRSDDMVPLTYAVTDADNPRNLMIEAYVRCHLQVELEDPELADRIGVETSDGERLVIMVLAPNSVNAYTDVELVDGRSGVVSVSSRAERLVLRKNGEVVDRVPLNLQAGEVNQIRR